MFVLKNLRYKNILHINHLEIPARQVTCILGESGSGKTTLLKTLNHMVDYEEGQVIYKGQNIKKLETVKLRREVVLVPQTPVIFPGTIKHNLLIGLEYAEKNILRDEQLIEELAHLGLSQSLQTDARDLSGGERQRIALLRALLLEPTVVLLDEPTSALDDENEARVIESVVETFKQKGITLIIVTHSKWLAEKFGEFVVTLSQGKVVHPEEVTANA